jgi:hypothetical protein
LTAGRTLLSPGMTVRVEIATGNRRILSVGRNPFTGDAGAVILERRYLLIRFRMVDGRL